MIKVQVTMSLNLQDGPAASITDLADRISEDLEGTDYWLGDDEESYYYANRVSVDKVEEIDE